MLLFQCSLQCYFLCSGDASPGCWDQTPGMNRAACTWGCSKKYLFSAGDLKKPLGLRTLWFACSLPLRPRNVPGANLVLPQVTQDTWQQHGLSKVPLWASSSEECFPKHYGPWCSWRLCAFFMRKVSALAFFQLFCLPFWCLCQPGQDWIWPLTVTSSLIRYLPQWQGCCEV